MDWHYNDRDQEVLGVERDASGHVFDILEKSASPSRKTSIYRTRFATLWSRRWGSSR
jgi:hypothetical protein